MKKNYTIAMWMNNYHESLMEQVNRIYESLLQINSIDYLKVNYLTASSVDKADEFVLSKENIKKLIEKNINSRNSDLGSRFSFFNFKDDLSSGVSVSTGIRKEVFYNTLIININEVDYSVRSSAEKIKKLFEQLIQINKSYYACLTGDKDMIGLDDLEKPKSVCWMNYWDNSIASDISIDKSISEVSFKKMNDGMLVEFKDLDMNNSLQKQINKLILNEL